MTHFLRDVKNNTIIESECWVKTEDGHFFIEVSSSVNIPTYSKRLLELNPSDQEMFITCIDRLSELRGWLWEEYFMGKNNDPKEMDKVEMEINKIYNVYADVLKLYHVRD